VAGCCECSDEPSGSCATELVMSRSEYPLCLGKDTFPPLQTAPLVLGEVRPHVVP
jgi:hypothetical protein